MLTPIIRMMTGPMKRGAVTVVGAVGEAPPGLPGGVRQGFTFTPRPRVLVAIDVTGTTDGTPKGEVRLSIIQVEYLDPARKDRLIGQLPDYARFASRVPGLANLRESLPGAIGRSRAMLRASR